MRLKAKKVRGLHSDLCLIFPKPHQHDARPLLLLVHGALRSSDDLLPWSARWTGEFDVALVDLPSHGRSTAPAEITFEAFVDEMRFLMGETFGARQVVIVGESLGGTVALAAANHAPHNLAGVVALDPPITTAKLYAIADFARATFDQYPDQKVLKDFFFAMFGVRATAAAIEERGYARYLEHLSVPALVLAGDRNGAPMPSLLDADDRERLRRAPVLFQEIAGVGHHLIDVRPEETHAAARNFILGLLRH